MGHGLGVDGAQAFFLTTPRRARWLGINTNHIMSRRDQRTQRRIRKIGTAHENKAKRVHRRRPFLENQAVAIFLAFDSLRRIIFRFKDDI